MDNTPNKVLERLVIALGGSKVVAPRLWPEKGVTEAPRLLLDCLNDDRPAKLDLAQSLFIMRLAKAAGVHDGMDWMADHLGYSRPVPVEPRDEAAELQRKFIETAELMARMAERIERLQEAARAPLTSVRVVS